MNEEDFLKKRLLELADKAYSRNICTFSNFLNLNEIDVLLKTYKGINYIPMELFGGARYCERKIARFGSLDVSYPIDCLHITPVQKKFSDKLTHRDFLGALINLGLKREVLGDIIIFDNEGYLFCHNSISNFIMENLTRIKHTVVKCELSKEIPESIIDNSSEETIQVPSLRLDAIISEIYRISRNQSQEIIREKRAFVNGRLIENNSHQLKDSDSISVRGMGKFIFNKVNYISKKGKLNISVNVFR